MSSLINLFKSKPVALERVPTDIVIPLHELDDTKTHRALCVDFSLRFDNVLDVEKLVGALERLIEKPGWRKLGARLRLNENDKLEYHIPAEYTKERPVINYTRVKHDISINSHPEGRQLLKPSGTLEVGPDQQIFRSLFLPPNHTKELADWIFTDRPQLQLHIVSFTDATLVTLSWIHTLLDAGGRQKLFEAWIAMLEGRETDIPEFYGYDFDPLAPLGASDRTESTSIPKDAANKDDEEEEEEYVLASRPIRGWSAFIFIISYLWDLLVHPTENMRILIIPPSFFARLKASALNDLANVHPATIVMDTSSPSDPKPFLSDGDVLVAWWTRLLISSQPWAATARPSKTIQVMNVFSYRSLIATTSPKLLPSEDKAVYIGNAVTSILSFFTFHDFLSLPLGLVAARLRSDIAEQTTRPQINASIKLAKEAIRKTGHMQLYGERDMMFTAFSNWSQSRHFEIDFGAAVVEEGGVGEIKVDYGGKGYVRGKPSYIQVDGTTKGFSVRNAGPCLGRDKEGNWWVGSTLRPVVWEKIIKAVQGM